jgi:hypothetical protein
MPKQVDVSALDEFCTQLFGTLDRLGGELLPVYLTERPTAFEKYPRLLLGAIQRYDGVEAGFDEWMTKVLRDASDHHRQDEFPELIALRSWLVDHRELFEGNRDTLNHLKRSLYGRAYAYLYPRRALCTAYAEAHRGDPSALEVESIEANFRHEVKPQVEGLAEVYDKEALKQILDDAESYLIAYRSRFRWRSRDTGSGAQ